MLLGNNIKKRSRIIVPCALAAVAAACDASSASNTPRGFASLPVAPAPYVVEAVNAPGQVAGRVEVPLDSSAGLSPTPGASLAAAPGAPCAPRPRSARVAGDDALVVWVDDARRGRPLPTARRFELTVDGCAIVPAVQVAFVDGTLNVRTFDDSAHVLWFSAANGAGDSTRVPLFESGGVVPLDRMLTTPGVIRVHCARHAWERAWIAVFDQPYVTLASPDGAFTIDSLPAGSYTVATWSPVHGTGRSAVRVSANALAEVVVRFDEE